MDVTSTWRRAVSAAKRTPATAPPFLSSSSSSSMHAAASFSVSACPPRGFITDPFTQQAREVLESIRAKEEMLIRSRGHYVDPYRYVPSRASVMTEQERDQVDQVMASFIIKCGSQIEIIRCALAEASSPEAGGGNAATVGGDGSRLAHYGGVVSYLAERLQDLGHTLQSLQSQRRKLKAIVPFSGGFGGSSSSRTTPCARRRMHMTPPHSPSASGSGNLSRQRKAQPVLTQSKLEVEEDEAFTRRVAAREEGRNRQEQQQRQVLLTQENRVLTVRLNNELEDVRMMEGKMLELSQLLGLFTGKLLEQQDQVEEIHEAARGAHNNVGQANHELLSTLDRNSKAKKYSSKRLYRRRNWLATWAPPQRPATTMFENSAILGGRHSDVLDAHPDTEESKLALVEEIKNRARGIFAAGNLPEAELLYDKAIAIKPDAVLFANRAAVRLGLNLTDSALADACKAIEIDPKYSKAYYRKGQAHNARREHESAVDAFEKGMELDPGNRSFRECATKAKAAAAKLAEEAAKTPSPPPFTTPATATTTTTTTTTSNSSLLLAAPGHTGSKKKKPKKKEGEAGGGLGEEDNSGEEDVIIKAEAMRGYKVLEDGRKTTYFNNTLSEEARRLIGDIAPKKIEMPEGGGVGGEGTAGSAWNYAGTFEERNMTEWATGRLQELLSEVCFSVPREGVGAGVEEGGRFDVKKVTGLEGDASVTFVRGKKKYLFDFVFTLEWEIGLLGGGKAKGTLKYPDVTPDNDDEYDTLLEVDQLTPPEARPLINAYVKSSSAGLQQMVREKLQQFMTEYQAL
ncbi:hypothetical protein VYU27_000330 [Nannochloropsis oceanica]